MDPFTERLMEKVFQKGEEEYALDEETREMMKQIREKLRESPRHQKSSSNTEEYFKNLQDRLVESVENETDKDKKKKLLEKYSEVIQNKSVIQSLCG